MKIVRKIGDNNRFIAGNPVFFAIYYMGKNAVAVNQPQMPERDRKRFLRELGLGFEHVEDGVLYQQLLASDKLQYYVEHQLKERMKVFGYTVDRHPFDYGDTDVRKAMHHLLEATNPSCSRLKDDTSEALADLYAKRAAGEEIAPAQVFAFCGLQQLQVFREFLRCQELVGTNPSLPAYERERMDACLQEMSKATTTLARQWKLRQFEPHYSIIPSPHVPLRVR